MPPTYTTNGSTALIIGIVIILVCYLFWWRKLKPVRRTHPRAVHPENEARLTDKWVRKVIDIQRAPVSGLDEHEEKLS